ncbi:MAG: hypothetical protein JSU74_14350 [Candidatus Zixiibacteriota bacterium]|nr:MAG: hypothetical protein JSU74_14350 [candidate division Zixibacteria bacterium]
MKHANSIKTLFTNVIVISVVVIAGSSLVLAQAGPTLSISHDFLPHQDFDEPIELDDGTTLEDAQVRLSRYRATLTYPIVFSGGRTILVNDFSYQLIDFEYKNWEYPLSRLHSASYTLMLQHRLSQKWSAWVLGTPSMASDLKAEVSEKDFNFQVVTAFIRHFSERLSVGIGVAYSTQFGSGEILPILAFDWNNGKNLMARAILPASFEFWYRPDPIFDIGLLVSGDGNNFRGDPEIYGVANPELRYTMLTVGPAVKINVSRQVRVNIEAGLIGLHRFEFYDADDEAGSYDLKPSQYLRVGLQYGG